MWKHNLGFSSGFSGRVEGGGRETWNLCFRIWWPSFLWLIFTGPGAMPPRPPPDPLLGFPLYVDLSFMSKQSPGLRHSDNIIPFHTLVIVWNFNAKLHMNQIIKLIFVECIDYCLALVNKVMIIQFKWRNNRNSEARIMTNLLISTCPSQMITTFLPLCLNNLEM